MAWRLQPGRRLAPTLLQRYNPTRTYYRSNFIDPPTFSLPSSSSSSFSASLHHSASLCHQVENCISSTYLWGAGIAGAAFAIWVGGKDNAGVALGEAGTYPSSNTLAVTGEEKWEDPIVTEEMTGCTFPRHLSGTERLVSAGARLMTPLKIRVYAVGVYFNPIEGKMVLDRWKGLSKDELLKRDDLWQVMCSVDSEFDRTIRVVVVREVDGSHMQNGFSRGLNPRVQQARKELGLQGGSNALKTLNKYFLKKKLFQEGCEILFRWSGRGTLDVYIDSKYYGRIENEGLCWSLWDLYLGKKSVTPHVKSQVAAGLSEFLSPTP